MAYDGYLKRISTRFNNIFSEISFEHNFHSGVEFEIAICRALRFLLPAKYGVCRGFIVTHAGEKVGDDIIIYNQENFPTLRLIGNSTYAQLEQIPIEAVYAYIEAKHTLYVDGDDGQSLTKALSQIEQVKNLTKKPGGLLSIDPHTTLPDGEQQKHWPAIRNPIYAGIFSRHVKVRANDKELDIKIARNEMDEKLKCRDQNKFVQPDFIIAGSDIICIPAVGSQIESPFYVPKQSRMASILAPGQAIGIGLSTLSWAMDWMKLGSIHWGRLISSGLQVPLVGGENQ
jgi:hypothetical protein